MTCHDAALLVSLLNELIGEAGDDAMYGGAGDDQCTVDSHPIPDSRRRTRRLINASGIN